MMAVHVCSLHLPVHIQTHGNGHLILYLSSYPIIQRLKDSINILLSCVFARQKTNQTS